ncbi:MAG: hypothetical protein WD801_12485 [Gemmatimonadaceae bacterium]
MARLLRIAGWPQARALVGGWRGWVNAGMPVEPRPPVPAFVNDDGGGGIA